MKTKPLADDFFFAPTGLDANAVERIVSDALHGMDDGELFMEYVQSESLVFDDGRLRNASFDTSQGFGLRSVSGETVGFAHANRMDEQALRHAAQTVQAIQRSGAPAGPLNLTANAAPLALYAEQNPIHAVAFADKVALLAEIDQYLRSKESLIKQVSISLFGEWQVIEVMRPGEARIRDIRPLVRLNVSVIVEKNGRMESGSNGAGGRVGYAEYITPLNWKPQADEALRQALVNLESRPAPAGEMPVVLGPGWCGILLHEAVGHGLEGDFNRKGTSTFSNRIGERVAAKGVTVLDDGTLPERRGSLTVDDEGTPACATVLIEDGILKGYMQDRMNARLMNMPLTGNGRRQGFSHLPMPRMTNTYMQNGTYAPEELIKGIDRGVYAVNFGGGQVDITSGKFVFSAAEAYMIEGGKVTHPLKGTTLIGNGPEVMQRITALGNDTRLDTGIGTCGKAGQSVPVGVGQPSLLIDKITIGGTEMAA
ncbi:MAG: metalloprotease TldD [Rickettsiales bacterium]|nr:metalloprotease TldD [Rickettsiales bacterium]